MKIEDLRHSVVLYSGFSLIIVYPNPDKPEIINYKHQITNKFQIHNIQISNKIKSQLFGILNFGHCDLFVICLLSIVI